MNCDKKISVCIPFYNLEPYVSRCLDSILENTYRNLEVICVNDGSSDGTSDLLHNYADNDSRVIVIDKENGGVMSARNAAIAAATGDFISFIDGDDWIHKRFFEVLMSVWEKSDADTVICAYKKSSEHLPDIEITPSEVLYEFMGQDRMLKDAHALTHIWGRVYKRSLIPSQNKIPQDITMGEDTALNLLFLYGSNDASTAAVTAQLYYYFQREGSMVHTVSHAEKIKVSSFLVENFSLFVGRQGKAVVLHEILRTLLTYRYLEMFCPNQAFVKQRCKNLYVFCKENWVGILPLRGRIKYCILYHVPALYRLFRIVTDPTMLEWERVEKKRQQEQKQV